MILCEEKKTNKIDIMRSRYGMLNSYDIGRSKKNNFGMNLLCDTEYYPKNTQIRLEQGARKLITLLHKVDELYRRAIKKNDKDILRYLESGILKHRKIRDIHRYISLSRTDLQPSFFRIDTPDMKHAIEFHSGLRGCGYLLAMLSAQGRAESIIRDACNFLQRKDLLFQYDFLYHNLVREGPLNEFNYFVHSLGCSTEDLDLLCYNNLWQPYSIFRRPKAPIALCISPRQFYLSYLHALVHNYTSLRKIDKLISSYSKRKLEIIPAPNLLHEAKIIMALAYNPKYEELFGQEKDIFAATYAIEKGVRIEWKGKKISLDDVVEIPAGKRSFILKYAGLDMERNFGARAVTRLRGLTRSETKKLLSQAINEFETKGEPWIIQEDISVNRNDIVYYNGKEDALRQTDMYTLYRPHFLYDNKADIIRCLGALTFMKNFYKVHAQENSACGSVVFLDNEE